MPRYIGAADAQTRKIHRTIREIVSDDEYTAVVHVLIDIIQNEKTSDAARIAGIKLLTSYIEGLPQQKIEHTVHSGVTLKDILESKREES